MFRLARKINDQLFPKLGFRVERFSTYCARQEEHEEQLRIERLRTSSIARKRILHLAQLVKPHDAIGHQKVRLGDARDGGYVCLDDFNGITEAFSFGISENSSWDRGVADRGILVHQFDHTVIGPPDKHTNFRFEKKQVAATGEESPTKESVASLLARYPNRKAASILLKIDIEHDEWKVLCTTPDEDLRAFSQLICEFHGFNRVIEDEWWIKARNTLEKLHCAFEVVHLHANNYSPWVIIGNVPFPDVLEATYASRLRYHFKETEQVFPTPIDAPNDPALPDMYLGRCELWSPPDVT